MSTLCIYVGVVVVLLLSLLFLLLLLLHFSLKIIRILTHPRSQESSSTWQVTCTYMHVHACRAKLPHREPPEVWHGDLTSCTLQWHWVELCWTRAQWSDLWDSHVRYPLFRTQRTVEPLNVDSLRSGPSCLVRTPSFVPIETCIISSLTTL